MKISLIIPTYNRAHTLARALDSVIKQAYPVSQIIVIDDASSDQTRTLLASYPGISYARMANNRGVSHARNAGFQLARGDWIAYLDSDDAWTPQKIQQQVAAAKAEPELRVFHSDEIWIRNGVRVNAMNKHAKPDGRVYEASLPRCCVSPSSVLLHRSVLDQCGGFDEHLPACEDYDLWLRVFSRYPIRLVEQALVIKYGGHADQLSRKHWGMDRFRIKSLLKMIDSPYLNERERSLTYRMLQHKCDILLDGAKKRGQVEDVARYLQTMSKAKKLLEITEFPILNSLCV